MLNNYFVRLVILGAALQVAQLCCIELITLCLNTNVSGMFLQPVTRLLPLMLAAIAVAVAIYWAGAHFLEQRRIHELPLHLAARNLVYGAACGILLCGLVLATLWAVNSVTYLDYAGFDKAAAAALIFTAGVVFEEFLFRGVILRVSEQSLGTALALILSSTLFAVSHLGNSGVTAIAVFSLFAGGIVLGLIYVLSRNLWLPIGAHLGWNFTLGALFGVAVSGHEGHGVLRFKLSGPDWLTGGRFGLESSICTMTLLLLLSSALWWYAARRCDWRARQLRSQALQSGPKWS